MGVIARIVLLQLCLAVLARGAIIHDGATAVDCSVYFLPMCTRDFNPVCGTDGATYSNECMLCLNNFEMKVNTLMTKKGNC